MASAVPFVIERRLQYHGIWNAGYNIGELFFKSIGKEFPTKPPYPAVLQLSVGSMTLTVYQKGAPHPKEIRTDTIPFGAIRDITVNPFNNRCLMVIYVNNKNKFSVLVTSCRDGKETADIATAFKRLSAIAQARKLQAERGGNTNWIIRKSVSPESSATTTATTTNNNNISAEEQSASKSITYQSVTSLGAVDDPQTMNGHTSMGQDSDVSSIKSRTDSSVLAENFEFLNEHEAFLDEDSVFGDDAMVDREEGPGEHSFSVGLQVDVHDRSDRISVSSETSLLSFQSIKDEVDSMTPSSAITEEEYSKKIFEVPINKGVQNGDERDSGQAGSSLVNGCKEEDITCHVITVDKSESYDFRGVGIQTEGLSRTRYTKRTGSSASSNVYKAMAAQRKLKQSPEDSSPRPPQPVPVQNNVPRARPSSYHVISKDARGGTVPPQQTHMSRTVRVPGSSSRSTISRPIEEVYQRPHTWSRRGTGEQRRRHLLVVHSGRNTLRL